jgi:hypothetical protein
MDRVGVQDATSTSSCQDVVRAGFELWKIFDDEVGHA